MSKQDRINLVNNIVSSMKGICGERKEEITNLQLWHFIRANNQLGMDVAKGLGITIDEKKHSKTENNEKTIQ